jgi:formate dehydrogenase subunit gamma
MPSIAGGSHRAVKLSSAVQGKIVRHAGVDRVIHWLIAACVLVLMATAFLPILGVEFAWVVLHWSTGFVLIGAVAAHLLRSLTPRRLAKIWIGRQDFAQAIAIMRRNLRLTTAAVPRPGKYSFAQKAIHLAFGLVVLAAIATGALMMVKIDTPWWDRNPYWLADATWGLVYVVHGLSALLLITMVMAHVYFALRPEKAMFLRAMLLGWITREEFDRTHDAARWRVPQ